MMEHVKYMHLERFGGPDVEGIEVGEGWVFPKLDGTNGSAWWTDGALWAGSRGRLLNGAEDNFGFRAYVEQHRELRGFFSEFPAVRLFGEWLVPHTFKHYREEAWRRFWVFDVWGEETQRWVPYEEYAPCLERHGIDFVPPLARVVNPTQEQLLKIAEGNTFLVQDGAGPGEGVVLKRYGFVNRFGRTAWAKVVRNEFKEKNLLAFGVPEKGEVFQVEVAIAEEAVTPALVAKERAKIEAAYHAGIPPDAYHAGIPPENVRMQADPPRSMLIPRLLETVYHSVVTEEMWTAVKKHKDPTVDFRKLRRFVQAKTKEFAAELF
jgi:hypothetical protein